MRSPASGDGSSPPAPPEPSSPAARIGCTLLVTGIVFALFGVAALLEIHPRIHLEFFEIELNDTRGRVIWTVGCLLAAGIGLVLLRRHRDRDE